MIASDRPDFGPAIVGGVLRYLSASSIKMFDPTVDGGCNRRWAGEKLGIWPKPPSTGPQERGTAAARALEHYLKTGEPSLPPYLLAGIRLLPKPGPDLEVERWMGGRAADGTFNAERAIALRAGGGDRAAIERLAGLAACGIPVVGAPDFAHHRGEYVDPALGLRAEDDPPRTSEIGDHKTSGDVDRWAKTAEYLATDVQMVGYAVERANRFPYLSAIRLSHVNYQAAGRVLTTKVTTLVPVDDLRRTWEDRVEPVVRAMVDVAKIKDVAEAEPNLRACDTFGGCAHRARCPLTPEQLIVDLVGPGGEAMSLFEKFAQTAQEVYIGSGNGAPPVPPLMRTLGQAPPIPTAAPPPIPVTDPARPGGVPVASCVVGKHYVVDLQDGHAPYRMRFEGQTGKHWTFIDASGAYGRLEASDSVWEVAEAPPVPPVPSRDATRDAEVAAARARLEAEDVARGPGPCGAPGCGEGCAPGWVKSADRSGGFVMCRQCGAGRVLPPDAARHDALNAALPPPPEAVAGIADPQVRQRAEDSARLHAAAEADKARERLASGRGGRCPRVGKTQVTTDQLAAREMVCECGKVFKGKKFAPVKDGAGYVWDVPKHNAQAAEAPPPPPGPDPRPPIPGAAPPPIPTAPPAIPSSIPALPGVPPIPTVLATPPPIPTVLTIQIADPSLTPEVAALREILAEVRAIGQMVRANMGRA